MLFWLEDSVNFIILYMTHAMLYWLEGSKCCVKITAHAMLFWLVEGSQSCVTQTKLCSCSVGVEDSVLHSVRTFGLDAFCVILNCHSVVLLLKQVVALFSVAVRLD